MSDTPRPLGFAVILGGAAVITLAAAAPVLGASLWWLVLLPARIMGWLLPGATPFENFKTATSALSVLGLAAGALALTPLLYAALAGGAALGLAPLRPLVTAAAPWLRRAADMLDHVCNGFGAVARWATLGLVAVVVVVVAQRYLFGVGITKLQETILYLHATTIMLGAAWTLGDDGHVRVDVFYGGLSERGKALVNLIGSYVLLAPACLILIIASGDYVDRSWRVQEVSQEPDGVPLVFLLKTLIPVFGVLMLAQASAIAARAALTLAGRDPGRFRGGPPHPVHQERV